MNKRRMTKADARDILNNSGAPLGADFFTLNNETVLKLLAHADTWNYRQPANANGSRGRYWHERLQRIAGCPSVETALRAMRMATRRIEDDPDLDAAKRLADTALEWSERRRAGG